MKLLISRKALELIAYGNPIELIEEAKRIGTEKSIIDRYKWYEPTWKKTAETRGALVVILRDIAKYALTGTLDE